MRPSALLVGIVITAAILLGLLWTLLARMDGPSPAPENVLVSSVDASAGMERAAAAVEGGEALSGSAPQLERAPVAVPASSDQTCRIRVVHAISRVPAPDARLWLQREDVEWSSTAWKAAMRRFNDVEPVLQGDLGQELALDAHGEVRVPRPMKELSLAAAQGELHGDATLAPGDAERIVELKAFQSLAVEVADRSGAPVEGAYVALFWGEFDPLDNGWTWITGADGRVWIPKLEEQLWPEGYRGPVRISLGGAVPCEPELVLFTTHTVPSEPVRLVAGDFGSVVVQLVDPKGEELTSEGYAYLEIDWTSLFELPLGVRGGTSLVMPLDSGRAVFACVGLGMPLETSARAKGHDNVERVLPGPTEPRQELRVLIPIGDRAAIARGRVHGIAATFGEVQPSGVLLQGKAHKVHGSFDAWLDQDGDFEAPIQSYGLQGLDEPWSLELSRTGGPLLSVTVVPSLDERENFVDFGDVAFESLPVLARARVIDDSDAAVPNARVETRSAARTGHQTCDENGRCIIAGRLTELPLSARASHHAWLSSDWVQVDAAESESTLVLRRGATLEGSLFFPRAVDPEPFELELRSGPNTRQLMPGGLLVEGSRFRFAVCEPGRATLTVSYDDRAVFDRPGIELVAGETTELEPIDLGAVLHAFELTFELESGAPWNGGHLEVREPDGELSTWLLIGPAARVSFLSTRSSVDLWVAARGARPKLFEGVLDGDHLVLPTAPSVVLRLSNQIHLPDPPLALMVRGARRLPEEVEFEPHDDVDVEDTVVGDDGTARLRVPWPGEYELTWFVRHTGMGVDIEIQPSALQTIRVTDSSISAVEALLTHDEVARAVLDAGG